MPRHIPNPFPRSLVICPIQMNNYKDRPLSKYVPDSPPPSPHMYQEDSFEAEQLSRSLPHAPIPPHNYELTFKKQAQGQYFMGDPHKLALRTLFGQHQHSILDSIRAPITEYHHKSMEELAKLPFADLMSMQLPDVLREKLGLIGLILQVKRMRLKASSVNVNIRCLKVKEGLSNEDKHRLYLLQLLWKQLSKKIFLEALKLNLAQSRYLSQFAEKQQEMQISSQQEMSHRIGEGQLKEEDYQDDQRQYSKQRSSIWQRQEEEEEDQESDSQNWQEKLMIFSHSITPIFHKQLFFAFSRIFQARLRQNLSPNPKSTSELQYESIPLVSRQNIAEQSENSYQRKQQSQLEQVEEAEDEISQSRLQELYFYIEELHEQCAQSQNLLKRYFIKLKINLLESIAQSMLQQIRANSMHPHQGQEEQHDQEERSAQRHTFRQEVIEQDPPNEDENMNSRYTSELSQDGSLKTEKRLLKEYLRDRRIKRFFYLLMDNRNSKKFASICADMRRGSLLHLAFRALLQNAKQQKFTRQMEGYYEQVANEQYEDDGPSKFFYRTNILYKYFQKFKQNHRNERMLAILDAITIKLAFRILKSHCFQEQRQRILVDRYRSNWSSRMMFKCFAAWRQVHLSENSHNERFRLYLAMKERDSLQHYFSILKLHFKKALIRQRKTDQYYDQKLIGKVFLALKCLYQQNRDLNEREATLEEYLRYSRGTSLMRKLKQFYIDYTAFQRFSIKEEKLRRTLIRLHALQGIKHWRKTQIRKQAYSAIEMKLVRYKNKQRKRQIFGTWLQRARHLLYNSGSNRSEQHKDWLVKYYGDLCSVLPS